jgi:alpha-mannosidase
MAEGARGNVLQLFDDRPHANDAWDIDFNFEAVGWEMDRVVSAKVIERGPIRTVLRIEKRTDKSSLTQDMILYEQLERIDFVNIVDWWEKRVLMKVAFPVAVRSRTATYEIQYGVIERATHSGASWDRAKFENAGHRWIDLSEGDYGVSLLNDCKYGFDVRDSCLRMSLLRSPVSPDPRADEGRHAFTYSLYPHSGDWRSGQTVRRAAELNAPLVACLATNHKGRAPAVFSLVSVDRDHVVIDAVKKAEDSRDVIVRLYEAHGQRGEARLEFGRRIRRATDCNLMEEEDQQVDHGGSSVKFYIRPFEIRTFKIRF